MKQNNYISVIIPFKDSLNNLINILDRLSKQSELPNEIVIINASINDLTNRDVGYDAFFKIRIKSFYNYEAKIPAYPGQNRNIGVRYSSGNIIFFIDTKTKPTRNWIKNTKKILVDRNVDLVFGSTKYEANSFFTNLILDLSYGDIEYESVPGTALLKKKFYQVGEFINSVRAGEDIEWRKRAKNSLKFEYNKSEIMLYSNIDKNFLLIIRKYFIYAFHNSNLFIITKFTKRISKALFFLITFFFTLLLIILLYFLINFMLLELILFNFIYLIGRGFLYPHYVRKVKIKRLLPYRWILIGFIGLILDTSKYLGYIIGTIINTITQSINIKNNLK